MAFFMVALFVALGLNARPTKEEVAGAVFDFMVVGLVGHASSPIGWGLGALDVGVSLKTGKSMGQHVVDFFNDPGVQRLLAYGGASGGRFALDGKAAMRILNNTWDRRPS